MKWRCLLETIAAVAIIGAGDAALTSLQGGELQPKRIGTAAGIGALAAVVNLYRKQPQTAPKPQERPQS